MEKEKTCAQLVYQKMQDQNENLERLQDILNDGESTSEMIDEADDELMNYSLEVSSYKVVKILLSTGGPADWIEVRVDDENYVLGMDYHYADWFDHAETQIDRNSYLWDYAINHVSLEQ